MYQVSPNDENGVLKAVRNVHNIIDKEITAGTNPDNIFVCGFSQGGLSLSLSGRLCACLHERVSACLF